VSIPAIGLNLPVFPGGQSVIDEGVVTHFWAPGWRPPVAAGQAGTYWLAAHHVTHGAPFLNLPSVRPGDLVIITPAHGGPVVRYVITSLQVVGTTVAFTTVYGTDTTTPRLLLQTCEGSAYRLLVHGVLA
jgi:sortase (surface protein transpeptidase)